MDRYLGTTKEQRKMARAVAKDVLASLKIYDIKEGVYCSAPESIQGKDIKRAHISEIKECQVCARGAMFLSRARLFNDYKFPDYSSNGACEVIDSTSIDFGRRNSKLIEAAFEVCENFVDYEDRGDLSKAALKFGRRFKSPRNRLKAIMLNVLDNSGVFRPDKVKAK